MSVQAMGWVFDHSPTKGTDRLVLLAIANHAGAEHNGGAWEAWPGVELLAREAGLDRTRTVNEALGRLVAAGHLQRVVNGAPDERIRRDRRPNLYRIPTDNGVPCGNPTCRWCTDGVPPQPHPTPTDGVPPERARGAAAAAHGVPPQRATGTAQAAPEPPHNHQGNHQEPTTPHSPPAQPTLLGTGQVAAMGGTAAFDFERFWQVYPRRESKGTARKAWAKAVAKVHPEVIVAGAARYRDDPNRLDAYTAHPATWLNGERWADAPLPPRAQGGRPAAQPRSVDTDRAAPSGRISL